MYSKCNFLNVMAGEASYKMRRRRRHCKEKCTTKQSIRKWKKGMWKTDNRSNKKCPIFCPEGSSSRAQMNDMVKSYRVHFYGIFSPAGSQSVLQSISCEQETPLECHKFMDIKMCCQSGVRDVSGLCLGPKAPWILSFLRLPETLSHKPWKTAAVRT